MKKSVSLHVIQFKLRKRFVEFLCDSNAVTVLVLSLKEVKVANESTPPLHTLYLVITPLLEFTRPPSQPPVDAYIGWSTYCES